MSNELLKQEIERGKNSPYTRDLIASFPDFRFPVWAFQEVISFGSFNYFTKFCSERGQNTGERLLPFARCSLPAQCLRPQQLHHQRYGSKARRQATQ